MKDLDHACLKSVSSLNYSLSATADFVKLLCKGKPFITSLEIRRLV